MRCRVGAVVRVGEAVTVPEGDADRLAAAVEREEPVDPVDGPPVAVDCPPPGPVHAYVSPVREGMGLRVRTVLAAAARSRGLTAPHDGELAAVREQLAELTVGTTTSAEERREAAEAATDTDRLRERVAAARGRLQAAREAGGDVAAASEALEAAVRELSEAETRAAAAAERFEAAREREREARDRLERRRRLQDRAANLERDARAALVAQVRGEYATAVRALDGHESDGDPIEAPPAVAALAVLRVAAVDAPVVLDAEGRVGRAFADAGAAAAWLDAPVIYIP
ncbi:MAG: hypothetical protein V5A30_05065 [Haloarculaceae archaeon]